MEVPFLLPAAKLPYLVLILAQTEQCDLTRISNICARLGQSLREYWGTRGFHAASREVKMVNAVNCPGVS